MGHSRVVRFVAFALCFFACVSASGTGGNWILEAPVETIARAKKAVEDARTSIKGLSNKVQSSIDNAEGKLRKLEECKKQTEEAERQAKEAGRDTDRDRQIVNNDNRVCNTVCRLNENAKEVLQNNVANLGEVLKEAKKLEGECDTELSIIKETAEEYKDTNNNVSYLQNKVGILTTHITDILNKMNAVHCTAEDMEESVKNAKLANLHVSVVVAVHKTQTMIKEADINIKETQNKGNEVNNIVREILHVCTTANAESKKIIKALCDSANDELIKVRSAVEKAKEDKEEFEKQKGPADTALKTIATANDVNKAQEEVDKAQACVVKGREIGDQLQSARGTAKRAFTNVKELKQNLVTALKTTTTAPNTEQTREAKKSDHPVGDGTETSKKDATKQPIITKTEQPTGNDSLSQNNTNADKLKNALNKGVQNVPTTALTGRKAPAPGAKNDSAMTVSVPLLVALIASAVLQ